MRFVDGVGGGGEVGEDSVEGDGMGGGGREEADLVVAIQRVQRVQRGSKRLSDWVEGVMLATV